MPQEKDAKNGLNQFHMTSSHKLLHKIQLKITETRITLDKNSLII